jgi:hypothetical protein
VKGVAVKEGPEQASPNATPKVVFIVDVAHSLCAEYDFFIADTGDGNNRGLVSYSQAGVKTPVVCVAKNGQKKNE